MKFSGYFSKLFIVTAALAVLTYILSTLDKFSTATGFMWGSLAFFAVLSVGVYYLGGRGVTTKNNHRFVSMITAAFSGKLLFCVFFILIYALVVRPTGKPFFVLPFFIYYIVYTILEVAEILRLSRKSMTKA